MQSGRPNIGKMLMESPFFVAKYNQHKQFLLCRDHLKGTVVDMGCGKKPFQKYLPDQIYIGVDNSHGNPDIVASVTKVPLEDNYADSIICSEVLEHLPEPMRAMDEIKRLLKTGGHLYLTVPMMWYLHYMPHDYWRFTNFSLLAIMSKYGFKVKYMNRYGGLNYFIACRIGETIYNGLQKFFKQKMALILLAPIQMLLYGYSKLDKWNKRDSAGWVILAEKV